MNDRGEGILDLVVQDQVWQTAEGEVVLVHTMTPRHLASVLRVLVAMEAQLHGAWVDAGNSAGGDDATAEGAVRAWFDDLPLVRRVRELLAEHNRAQRVARFSRPPGEGTGDEDDDPELAEDAGAQGTEPAGAALG